jgi:hypothetical protein
MFQFKKFCQNLRTKLAGISKYNVFLDIGLKYPASTFLGNVCSLNNIPQYKGSTQTAPHHKNTTFIECHKPSKTQCNNNTLANKTQVLISNPSHRIPTILVQDF